jgi:LCP family protein required for cell wall assembly
VQTEADRIRYGDAKETPGSRADVILALRVRDDGSISLLRLPRDLIVMDENASPARLTTSLLEGRQEVAATLCRSLGLGVDHYLEIRFPGVRSIVNSIGGIDVTVEHPTRDLMSGLRLKAGSNHLDGDGALAYIGSREAEVKIDGRWRPDTDSPGSRSSKATEVLADIGSSLDLSVWHPIRSQRRIWTVAGAIVADSDLGPSDALALRGALGELVSGRALDLPVDATPAEVPGDVPYDKLRFGAADVLKKFDGPQPAPHCTAHLAEAVRR